MVGLLLPLLAVTGCFNARIGASTSTANRRDTIVAVASYLWGTVMDDRSIGNDSLNAFSDVEVTQDFGQVAVSLVTLGLYVPMTAHCYFEVCDNGRK